MPYNASDELSYWKCIVYAIILKLDQKAFFKKRRKITVDEHDIVDNDFFSTHHTLSNYIIMYDVVKDEWMNIY